MSGQKSGPDDAFKGLSTSYAGQIPPAPALIGGPVGAAVYHSGVSVEASGPLPLPAILAGYGSIDPSFPDRIMVMAEKNGEAERLAAAKAQRNQLLESILSRLIALAFAGLALCVTLILALKGHDAVAGIVGGTTLLGVTASIVVSRRMEG